ncbi:hypothetical protein [Paenibacillus sp. IITD108]|uniref:hypothetical protein n=1 Tax=Paenibacillus sp. IITD108 TaxID=3116649 RepID=UPI002F41AF6C
MSAVIKTEKHNIAVELLLPYLIYKYVVGEEPSNANISYRILWQKIGYFAKKLGLPLNNYDFSWYKRGPYSSNYTSVLYKVCNDSDDLNQQSFNFELNDLTKEKLIPLLNAFRAKPPKVSESHWMELLASIDYLYEVNNGDKTKTLISLTRLKPIYSDEYLKEMAWNVLTNQKMI